MRRLILAALAVAACAAGWASTAEAQDTRVQRDAQVRERRAERQAKMLEKLQERRPELKQRIEQRLAKGRSLRPLARKMAIQRRLHKRPDLLERFDLNKDGKLQRNELRHRRRHSGRA
jgi:hypothetical protein